MPKIIQIIQAVDCLTALDDQGNIYALVHKGNKHYWVLIPITEGEPIAGVPTGPDKKTGVMGN